MSIENIMLLESFCRTCMNGSEEDDTDNDVKKRKAISIFNKPDSMECKNTIMELLIHTTPQLNIDSDDLLPKVICETCLERLINAYKFQEMCIRVEQKFRQMMKDENPVESPTTNKDPLKDCLVDISVENVAGSKTLFDLSNILKIEVDETLIDQNELAFSTGDTKLLTYDNQCEDTSASEQAAKVDSDSEWEMPSQNTKSRNGGKIAVKKKRVSESSNYHKNCKDKKQNEDEPKSSTTDEAKKFECTECGNCLATRSSLMRHKRIHSINATDSIKEDKQMSVISEDSKKNVEYPNKNKDDESKKFICDECGRRLTTRQILRRHKRIHLRNAVNIDKEYEKTSIIGDESKKNEHPNKNKDDDSKKFVCDVCGKHLKTREILRKHKRNHLRPARNPLECEFCKKDFQKLSALKEHLRMHTGEQPYLCSKCGKGFKYMISLKQHFVRHSSDRPYACPDCPKRFYCLSNLSAHKNVHTKQTKSHVCDVCGSAFIQAGLLRRHKVYHGERNHKCDFCEMRFFIADHCRRHMRTHTGEKPYKCKYCERAYAQSNDLIKHLKIHLGDNVYKCDLCPQGFPMQSDLRVHFSTHKNDDEDTRTRNIQALRDEQHRLQMKFNLDKCT